MFRIRSDPYHWAGSGSGSTSGNVDMDPGTKKNLDKLAYKSTSYKNTIFLKRNHLFFLIYANNKLKITKNLIPDNLIQKKLRRKNWNLFDFRSDPDPDPEPFPDPDPSSRKRIRIRIKMIRIRNTEIKCR